MGLIGFVHCEKFRCDFVPQTFAFIALVQYVLQQVSCSYETIPNALKYYKTDRNISLGPNTGAFVAKNLDVTLWHELLH